MKEFLWLIVALPFAGSLLLALAGKHLPRLASAMIGVGSVALSAILVVLVGLDFLHENPAGVPFHQTLWQWINVSGFSPGIAFQLDSVSLTFIFVITFVGALIHLYSAPFMWKEEGFARFFSCMNLFVGFMLLLVLADNFLLLYLGWEGVGLCSYLLIGFWYKDPANGHAARKAFTVTRVGDTAMVIGLFILFTNYHTLNIRDILHAAPHTWAPGSRIAITTAFLLLGGAIGKSAQVPLQTWLPDAMAAPSPVSALIHAATMVTAGVYLIARTHVLFELAPIAQNGVAVIGAITLIVAGMAAIYQHDIKKVLAYSTISQIGYMFLALGVGAWSAALFHFMIHAFFKSLLFLGAGSVIAVLHDEHNMYKMGGLWKKMPVVFWTFLVGACALSALPLITAGFYSKDEIIWQAYASEKGSITLWLTGLAGAFITALYTFRMVFLTFFGQAKAEPSYRPGLGMTLPLVVLAFLSFAGGFIQLPDNMGHVTLFSHFIEQVLPAAPTPGTATTHAAAISATTATGATATYTAASGHAAEWIAQSIAAALSIAGLVLAYRLYYNKPFPAAEPIRGPIQQFFFKGWNFDALYDKVIVQPIVFLSRIDKNDIIDQFYTSLASIAGWFNKRLASTQNGKLRWYAMALAIGTVITLTILLCT